MACFIAPATEAVIATVAKKIIEKKEQKRECASIDAKQIPEAKEEKTIKFSTKLGWLTNLLWGGSFLLLIEHIWHGEIVPWAPFLTAMGSAEDAQKMLGEIATVGTSMAVLVTVVWVAIVAAVKIKENGKMKNRKEDAIEETAF